MLPCSPFGPIFHACRVIILLQVFLLLYLVVQLLEVALSPVIVGSLCLLPPTGAVRRSLKPRYLASSSQGSVHTLMKCKWPRIYK